MEETMRVRLTCFALACLIVAGAATQASASPGDAFAQASFYDENGNGVVDHADPLFLVPTREWYNGSNDDFYPGEYRLWVDNIAGRQHLTVDGSADNTGDVDIRRDFPASEGEIYEAEALVQFQNVRNGQHFWARLTIQPVSYGSVIPNSECNALVKASKDLPQEPVLEPLQIEPCSMPPGTTDLTVKVRAHTNQGIGFGTVIVHEVAFSYAGTVTRT